MGDRRQLEARPGATPRSLEQQLAEQQLAEDPFLERRDSVALARWRLYRHLGAPEHWPPPAEWVFED